ncbi:hypothetical protein Tco_0055191 [Tanacetum coccineum]
MSSVRGTDPTTGVFSYLTGSDFLVGSIRTIIKLDKWSLTNGSRLDDGRICREMVDEFSPPKFFASVRMRAEYNVKEKRRFKSVVERQGKLLKVRKGEIKNLKAQLSLRDKTNALKERNSVLEKERNALDVKVIELEALVASKERELTNLDVKPFSAAVLTGTEGTSDTAAATANTNTALSITFSSASSIAPISVDDYEVVGAVDQAVADENAAFFPNVDDAKLNIPQ